jgi:hypothetical protein
MSKEKDILNQKVQEQNEELTRLREIMNARGGFK